MPSDDLERAERIAAGKLRRMGDNALSLHFPLLISATAKAFADAAMRRDIDAQHARAIREDHDLERFENVA